MNNLKPNILKTYSVYILECSDETLYIGVTSNLESRMRKHESSFYENSYTSSRLPVELIYQENFQFVQMAIDREKQIKRWSKQKKLALINKSYKDLSKLAKKEF